MSAQDTVSSVEFTLIRASGPMSKAFRLDPATGRAVQTDPPVWRAMRDDTHEGADAYQGRDAGDARRRFRGGTLINGQATRQTIERVADLAPILRDLSDRHVVVPGSIVRDDIGEKVTVITVKERDQMRAAGRDVSRYITRTKDDLQYRPGAPALLGLDHDAGRLPDEFVERLRAAGGTHEALMAICPALRGAETLIAPSSSAGILREADGGAARDSASMHLWMIAQDGDPEALKAFVQRLHERAILAGWGWVFISDAGPPEVRSLIDVVASGVGERLWYSGPTILLEGLVQREGARDPRVVHAGGGCLDAASALAPLDEGETVRLGEIERELLEAHSEEIARVKAARRENVRERMLARGASEAEIDRRFATWETGELDGEALLTLDDGSVVEVAEVLRDVNAFLRAHGGGSKVTMADPEEPDYGRGQNVAVLGEGDGLRPSIFSHAHGGRRFVLGWSAEDIRRSAGEAMRALAGAGGSEAAVPVPIDKVALAMDDAIAPMFARCLPSAGWEAIDAALADAGVELEAIEIDMIAPLARDTRDYLNGLARGLVMDGEAPAGLGLRLEGVDGEGDAGDGDAGGGAICPHAARRLLDSQNDVQDPRMEALAPGLGAAWAAFWDAARSVDPEGAERLLAAVDAAGRVAADIARGRLALQGAWEDAPADGGDDFVGGSVDGAARDGAAAGDAAGEEQHDDAPLEGWLPAGAAARKASQHNALRVLMNGLRLGPDAKGRPRLRRDLRAGGILLSRVRKGSEAWNALGLGRAKPSFIEPLTDQPVWEWTDDMTNAVVGWAQAREVMVTAGVVHDAVLWVANKRGVDPVADYLQRLERLKVWDGVRRLDGWLVRHGGAEEGPVGERALAMFMLGAVARALVPVEGATGDPAQVDTVTVLAGPQGGRKSEMMRVLARVLAWHSESVVGGLSNPENILVIHRSWITDISEGASLKKSEVTVIKQFITTRQDVMRMKYGRLPVALKRRGVLVCTVNDDGGGFLADGTGARRFMVCGVQRIDIGALKAEVDLLWAEAVARYRAGEAWWVREDAEDGTEEAELRDAMAAAAEARRVKTGAEELVRRWLAERPAVTSSGRVQVWEARPAPISVLPAGRVLDMLEQIGLDVARDDYSPAKVGRALSAMGWASVKVNQTGLGHLGIDRNSRVWLSPSGLAVLRQAPGLEERSGEKAGSRFRRWAEEQHARGAIFGVGGVVDHDAVDPAGEGMHPE